MRPPTGLSFGEILSLIEMLVDDLSLVDMTNRVLWETGWSKKHNYTPDIVAAAEGNL